MFRRCRINIAEKIIRTVKKIILKVTTAYVWYYDLMFSGNKVFQVKFLCGNRTIQVLAYPNVNRISGV